MKLVYNITESIPHAPPRVQSNYNTIDEILTCNEPLGIDGIYRNVYENRWVLEKKEVILFVMGAYIGKDNSFDEGMLLEKYCNKKELMELVDMGCKLGFHTWTHPDLTKLSKGEIIQEITPPTWIPTEYFAYPYGTYNEMVMQCVKEVGYKQAWSVTQGNDNHLTLYRDYL